MTGTPGHAGWFVVSEPHRCSRKWCPHPAVIYYTSRTYRPGHPWQRRFICAEHMNQYNSERPWWIDGDRVMRAPYDHEVTTP